MPAGKAPDPMADLPQGAARDQAAQLVGISPRSIDAASKVRTKGTAELVRAVETDQVKVSAAVDLADLPPDEQAEVVAKGKKAATAKAKEIRKSKKKPPMSTKANVGGGAVHADDGVHDDGAVHADDGAVAIALPINKPTAQARLLVKHLGQGQATRLLHALAKVLHKPMSAAAEGSEGS